MDRFIPDPHSRGVTIRQDAAPIYYLQPVAEHRRVVQVGPRHDAGQALNGYQAQQIQLELDVQMIGRRVHEPFLFPLGKAWAIRTRWRSSPDRPSQISPRNMVMSTCSSARLTDAMSAAEHSCRAV